jgi:hypothetical protein
MPQSARNWRDHKVLIRRKQLAGLVKLHMAVAVSSMEIVYNSMQLPKPDKLSSFQIPV